MAAPDGSTWAAWIDGFCVGTLRAQLVGDDGTLLAPESVEVAALPGCHSLDVLLAACTDGSAVVCEDSPNPLPLDQLPVHRISKDGRPMWGTGLVPETTQTGRVGAVVAMSDGDAVVVWLIWNTMVVQRFDAAGAPVWPEALVLDSITPNFKLNAAIPGADGGLMLVWDRPTTCFRQINAARITPEGTAAWPGGSVVVTPNHPFASRHTPHAIVSDGEGGVWIAYTRGAEQPTSPMPIDVQHVRADGSLEFAEPLRISLGTQRQFEANAWRDGATGDVIVIWRDGAIGSQQLRAQRMTAAGARLFADQEVLLADVAPTGSTGLITGHWTGSELLLTYAEPATPGEPSVRMRSMHGDGTVEAEAAPLSGSEPAFALHNAMHGDDQVIMWLRQEGPSQMTIVAQLVHPDGSLGPAPTHPADFNGDGSIDGPDLAALLGAWTG